MAICGLNHLIKVQIRKHRGIPMTKPATGNKLTKTPRTGKPGPKRTGIPANVPLIRVNFDISRAEHTKLKIIAAKNGVSMADILRSFVTQLKLSNSK
jgi:hypothetical protein